MSKLIAFLIFVLMSAMLIGAGFGFSWAGGEGYVKNYPVVSVAVTGEILVDRVGEIRKYDENDGLKRGEIVKTQDGSRIILKIGPTIEIGLDERTDLEIKKIQPGGIVLRLSRGRIIIDTHGAGDQITVLTNYTSSEFRGGSVSMANFDFKETVDIYPVDTEVIWTSRISGKSYGTANGTSIPELNPEQATETIFDPLNSSASAFYTWYAESTEF